MYCRYCGKENSNDSRFCSNCGKKLSEDVPFKGRLNVSQFDKYKKILFLYIVWCLIHIGLMIFSSPSDVHHKGDFYPFDTSLSNVLQWKKFWCDPLKNIDVYDSSELFFYTILLPFLVWGIVKIWLAVFRSIRNFCQKV